ncbi:MAG: fluoride efflux transporter CrcB [Pseudomonadota bacterium]
MTFLLIAAGAAVGALLRYAASTLLTTIDQGFPYNTLFVNLLGAALIGLCWGLWRDEAWFFAWGRAFLLIGLLGGFTTFSALSLEVVQLLDAGRALTALTYVLSTIILGILSTLLAYLLVRQL